MFHIRITFCIEKLKIERISTISIIALKIISIQISGKALKAVESYEFCMSKACFT